ncbi:MAG: hypothetical protein IKJ91_12505 [Clostridia bacterium]|nr:hypothetical protein [Clostridia bacterium]
MKKIIFALLSLILCLTLIACGGKANENADNTGNVTNDSAVVTEKLPERNITEIYGIFNEQYDFIYEDICLVPGTFTQQNPVYSMIEKYEESFDRGSIESISSRLPAICHLAKELSLTDVDLNEYYTACFEMGIIDIMPSNEIMKTIVSGDAVAIASACAHPSALAKEGKVYTLRQLLEVEISGISDDEIRATVESAKNYYGSELLKSEFLSERMKEKLSALGYEIVKDKVGTLCTVHADEYHTIPSELEALVDSAKLSEWKANAEDTECGGGANIADFVKAFDISKEKFIEIYNSLNGTLGHYNIDEIYGDAPDAYYSEKHPTFIAEVEADRAMAALKAKVAEDKGMTDFVTNVHEFSLAELLIMVDKDDAYIAELEEFMSTLVGLRGFSIGEIYDRKDEFTRMLSKRTPYAIDRMVSGRAVFENAYDAHK